MTGHMMGAAGAFEAFATVMSVAEQCVPPTINYRDFDPECDLWVVTEATPMPIRYALSQQHRARRPQRRRDLQAVRRRLTLPTGRANAVDGASLQSGRAHCPEVTPCLSSIRPGAPS